MSDMDTLPIGYIAASDDDGAWIQKQIDGSWKTLADVDILPEQDTPDLLDALNDGVGGIVATILADNKRLRDALKAAATSLEVLALAGSRKNIGGGLEDLIDVRAFATSRAGVARAALAIKKPAEPLVPSDIWNAQQERNRKAQEKPTEPRLAPHGRIIHEKGTIDVTGFPYPPETETNEPAETEEETT
jgi:hypothetical protein